MASARVARILQILLVAFLGIGLRTWYLSVFERDQLVLEADKPKRRVILERPERGLILDRFGIPLAQNQICYRATILYHEIAQLPSVSWVDEGGERLKTHPRRTHIHLLAHTIAQELSLDPARVEDLIHSKASLFPHTPFPLKTHLTESEYYRIRALERSWVGLHGERGEERTYPQGMSGCHLVGTMGAISGDAYRAIASELHELQEALARYEEEGIEWLPAGYTSIDEVYARHETLRERAYTLNDFVGKTGLEGQFEELLRGVMGRHIHEIDRQGHIIRELPGGRPTRAGATLHLSLSAELQQFAEELLAQDEQEREGRSSAYDPEQKARKTLPQPWIKGGAIVALDPTTGEVLALASTPRFDPNDFLPNPDPTRLQMQSRRINRWLETPSHIAALWDGLEPLVREKGSAFQSQRLTWDFALATLFPDGPLRAFWNRGMDVRTAVSIQEDFETLRYFSGVDNPLPLLFNKRSDSDPALEKLLSHYRDVSGPWARLESHFKEISTNEQRLLLVDLCRLAVYSPALSDSLLQQVGSFPLSKFRELSQERARLEESARRLAEPLFHKTAFTAWRTQNQSAFLAACRAEEKAKKTYARPYLDYLDRLEATQFREFWNSARLPLLSALIRSQPPEDSLSPYWESLTASLSGLEALARLREATASLPADLLPEYLRALRSYNELDRPLYSRLRNATTERDLAALVYPRAGFGYCRSYGFQSSAPLGSLFKIVTAAEAIRQTPDRGNPLTLVDKVGPGSAVAYTLEGTPYNRQYKGGRLPKSALAHIGRIDLPAALEQSSNPYFSILAGDFLEHPNDLARAAYEFGFGERTGLGLAGEVRGSIPTDLEENKTGLYSFAIGQHTFLASPLQAALMLSAVANGGHLLKPHLQLELEQPSLPPPQTPPAKQELALLGFDFSPFSPPASPSPLTIQEGTEIVRALPLSRTARNLLLQGMDRVMWGPKGSARPHHIRNLALHPNRAHDYLSLEHQVVGKTSTAEVRLQPTPFSPPELYKHIWFGALSFESSDRGRFEKPELAVVVFLRYGESGREAAPLATQVVRKWREIKRLRQM